MAKLALLSRKATLGPSAKKQRAVPHRSLRRRLAPQAIDELVARYMAGETTSALGQAFRISESGVRKLLQAEGVILRGHKLTAEDAEQAVQLYARGLTITQVAQQLGYAWGTIRSALVKRGAVLRSDSSTR